MHDYFVMYLITGAFAGTLSGLLGIGGGTVVVPCLMWVYAHQGLPNDMLMHIAAGTSLASMVVTTLFSMLAHRRHGIQIGHIYKRLVIGVVIGTVLGAIFADYLHSHVLRVAFGMFLLVIAMRMMFMPNITSKSGLPKRTGMSIMSLLIGGKSGLLGIGGGSLSIPFLTYCNVPLRQAVGASTACSMTIAVVGALTLMITGFHEPGLPAGSIGYVYWPGVLGIIIASPAFAFVGTHMSHRLPVHVLKRIFAVFLLLTSLHMLV